MKIFEHVNQQGIAWVTDMMVQLQTTDSHQGLHALRAGLQALRDRLTVEEAAQLSAQLPVVVRGLFFDGWHPAGKPLRIRHRAEFLALVREKYAPRSDLAAEDIVKATFRVLRGHVSEGELTDIMMTLPGEIVDVVTGSRAGEEHAER
jgi:uncharacterized protein (DUF2267 family)